MKCQIKRAKYFAKKKRDYETRQRMEERRAAERSTPSLREVAEGIQDRDFAYAA
jgi:hypothetical protein